MNRKIAISGASGLIGSKLTTTFQRQGHCVHHLLMVLPPLKSEGKNMLRKANLCSAMFLVALFIGCSAPHKVAVRPNEHMEIGWTPRTIFQSPSYAAWFDTGYAHYKAQEDYLTRLRKMSDSVEIIVVYGTWCSDSRRELPHFWKIVDSSHYPSDHISMIAVDRTMQLPAGIQEEYGITSVPTFIIHYRRLEIGRITESAKTSLEQDLVDWLSPLFPAQ